MTFRQACSEMVRQRDPFALIESGALKIRTKAGKLIALTPETMKPGQLRAYLRVKELYQQGKPVRMRWLKYRQGGFSTLAELLIFAVTICNDYYNSLCLSNVSDTATWIFGMSKLFQEQMETAGRSWMKLKVSSRQEIVWEGSRSGIRIGSSESRNIGISETRQALHASEVAYMAGWMEMWGNLSPSIPYLPRTIIIEESTANGAGDHWHQAWLAGEKGEGGFENQFFPWYEDPDYAIDPPPGWEPDEEAAALAEQYGLTLSQLYWRERKIEDDFAGDRSVFSEKYPATPEEAFRATGSIVFNDLRPTLQRVLTEAPAGRRYSIEQTSAARPALRPTEQGIVEMWEEYRPDATYVMYSDVSEGLKDVDRTPIYQDGKRITTSYSTCIVRRIEDWVLCALLECRYPPDVFSQEAALLGRYYGEALWGIEIPGPGMAVIAYAQQHYPLAKLYRRTWRSAQNEYREQTELGFRNDSRSKPVLESDWAQFVRERGMESGMLSARIAAQALTYIQDERTGKHRPRAGTFSDLLLADMGAIQLLKTAPREDKQLKQAMDYAAAKRAEKLTRLRTPRFRGR